MYHKIIITIFSVFILGASISSAQEKEKEEQKIYKREDFTNSVSVSLLNKITARVSSMDIALGEVAKFGNLEIKLQKCWKAPPEEKPESEALLKVWEEVPGEEKKEIFHGWMFASSPAISALEHPVYDITVLGCKDVEKKKDEKPEK